MGLPLLPLGYYSTVIFQNWHCQRQARELEGPLTCSQLGIPPFLITRWPCMKMLHIKISWCLWTCHRFTVMDILSSHLQEELCFFSPTNFCSLFIPIALVHMPTPNKQWLDTKNPLNNFSSCLDPWTQNFHSHRFLSNWQCRTFPSSYQWYCLSGCFFTATVAFGLFHKNKTKEFSVFILFRKSLAKEVGTVVNQHQ